MRKLLIILLLSLLVLFSYAIYRHYINHNLNKPPIADIQIKLPIIRLEEDLFKLSTQTDINFFLQANPLFRQQFLGINQPAEEQAIINQLHQLVQNPAMQELYQEVMQVFGDLTPIQQQLEEGFRYFRYYYPHTTIPTVMTFITGMGTDLHVSPNLIVIGLDCFLGENARFRPLQTPQYILRTYQPDYIAPKVFLLFSQHFQKNAAADHTLLHDMLAYGKAYYFTKALLPHVSNHIILGYTPEQLADTQKNQHIVWAHFIENQLLYNTNHLVKKHYLGNRPFTAEIGPKCPGNIGGWLGWEIIKQYMQHHPQVTLPALMEQTNAQHILTESKYRPKK